MRSCYPYGFFGVHPRCPGKGSPRTRASLEEMRVDSTGGLWSGSVEGRDDGSGHPRRPLCGDSAFDAPFLECWPVGAGLSVRGRRASWQREGKRGRRVASLAKSVMPPALCQAGPLWARGSRTFLAVGQRPPALLGQCIQHQVNLLLWVGGHSGLPWRWGHTEDIQQKK